MADQFSVQTADVRTNAAKYDQVVATLSQVMGAGAPQSAAVATSQGQIASPVIGALDQVLGSRQATLQATSTSSQTIGDLLRRAAQMYDEGDVAGAERLRAAADALADPEGTNGTDSQRASTDSERASTERDDGTSTGSSSAGADQAGQLAGQVGQQVGQLGQAIGQAVAGLVQGLTQLPQQIVQGVQSATQAGADENVDGTPGEDAARPGEEEKETDPTIDDRAREDEGEEEVATVPSGDHAQPDDTVDGAAPGDHAGGPLPPPVAERAVPAQTRPQQSAP
ncbi:MAG: type VII secretion target [Mycobacterium sp.]